MFCRKKSVPKPPSYSTDKLLSNVQERLSLIKQGLTKQSCAAEFKVLGKSENLPALDKANCSILGKGPSGNHSDIVIESNVVSHPEELNQKTVSHRVRLQNLSNFEYGKRIASDNESYNNKLYCNSYADKNVLPTELVSKPENLQTPNTGNKSSKKSTEEPFNVINIEPEIKIDPHKLNQKRKLDHQVRLRKSSALVKQIEINDRNNKLLVDSRKKVCLEKFEIYKYDLLLQKLNSDILTNEPTEGPSDIVIIESDRESDLEEHNNKRLLGEKNLKLLSSNRLLYNYVTILQIGKQRQTKSIQERFFSFRCPKIISDLECKEAVTKIRINDINSRATFPLNNNINPSFDAHLKIIEDKMKNLTIKDSLGEIENENCKRILSHNTRLEIFKDFAGSTQFGKLERQVVNRKILKAKRPGQQHRLFSMSRCSDGIFDANNNKEMVESMQICEANRDEVKLVNTEISLPNPDKLNNTVSDTKKTSVECKHIEVKGYKEIQHIQERYPFPKNVLHNYYHLLSEQLKDKSLKIEPYYKSTSTKHGTEWLCMYHLKWPENCKVSAKSLTKKKASSFAALKCLSVLSEYGKISSDGLPLVYTREEVKKLTQKKQTELRFEDDVVQKMQNIVDVFNNKMSPIINGVDYSAYHDQEQDILNEGNSVKVLSKTPKYLGMHQYLAKEKLALPVSKLKESFIGLIQNNNCVIVKGEPGCGKSSRIPQYVLEAWVREASSENQLCRIAVTQPRRIAAISLAERVASERDEQLGHVVGYQVRLKSNFQSNTGRILYCTTGLLLRHLQSDPYLAKFSHVILDEAHERDVNTDLLMNLMKKAMGQNNNLKVVVMSATIDAEEFSEYFGRAPICNVPGFTYPVKRHYLGSCKLNVSRTLNMCHGENPRVVHEDVVKVLEYIHKNKPEGAILTFLPGWEDLVKIQKLIPANGGDVVVHLVHSRLKDSEQHKIFSKPPPGVRKIILATNIAETSITIDDVVYVVDTGIHKDQIFDNDKGINILDMEWISKASANQRAGRAGRCSPGESYHLYTQEKFNQFPEYSSPKILNSSLTKVVLDSKMFSNNMDACDFMNGLITPPEKVAVQRAVDELKQLELLDEHEKLTPLGKTLVNFQLEPNLAKVMVNAVVFKCTTPIVDIVTLFSSDSGIFGSQHLTDKDGIKNVKARFSKASDHLALMRVYEKWLELCEEGDPYQASRFCRETNLVPYKLEFVNKLKKIHYGYLYNGLYESVKLSDDFSDNDEMVKAVLYSGTGTVLQHRNWDIVKNRLKTNANVLVTRNNHKATITGESVNYKRNKFPSNFLVYINETRSNIRRTTIVRECSLIPSISVLLFSKELEIVKASKSDNLVIIGIKNTKLQFLCDKSQAETIMNCKKAIDGSYKYLIHQLTYGGEDISEFLKHWDDVLNNLGDILIKFRIE